MRAAISITKKTIFLLIVPLQLSGPMSDYYVLWDVGQGQWLSHVKADQCLHYDVGGENKASNLEEHCFQKEHLYTISHWDYDHYNFLKYLRRNYGAKKMQVNRNQIIYDKSEFKTKNDNSLVLQVEHILISGDAGKKAEAKWYKLIQRPVKIYILGHHGSNTSSGDALLSHIAPSLRQTLCSARKAKYGHPHQKVKKRISKVQAPLICTQDWGNIVFR